MANLAEFDRFVGKIAGAIYLDISRQFHHPPLMLVPAITFKVRKAVERIGDFKMLSTQQKCTLANSIKQSLVPMLFSYEVEPDVIEKVTPVIEAAALTALRSEV